MAKREEMELKDYEMMIVLKPLLPDDVRKEVHKNFINLLKKLKGKVVDIDVWGKRYLVVQKIHLNTLYKKLVHPFY
jgi:ribosomal protein S6